MLAVVLGWSRRCEVNLRRLSSASRESLEMYVGLIFFCRKFQRKKSGWMNLPLCIEGFSSSNPHVDVARGGAVKGEDVMSFVDWWLVTGYVTLKLKQ